jgi:hypothetical protein
VVAEPDTEGWLSRGGATESDDPARSLGECERRGALLQRERTWKKGKWRKMTGAGKGRLEARRARRSGEGISE